MRMWIKLVLVSMVIYIMLDAVCAAKKHRRPKRRKHPAHTEESLVVGCDGVLGSGLTKDKCGVCGGTNTECQIFSGIMDKSIMSIGYHTVVTIPAGAMYVNITEVTRSRNYLGLKITGGVSVFNGDWRIDYPGNYSAGGTNVMYTRSARSLSSSGEQILIMGPTTVDLDVRMIYQERNPGISYEYVIPNPPGAEKEEPPPPGRQQEEEGGGRQTSQQQQPTETQPPPTTRKITTRPTSRPTTTRTTTKRPTTTAPTTAPPPPPPPSTTNAPLQEEPKAEKGMSISSGIMPGNGMGDKEQPEGFAGVMPPKTDADRAQGASQGLQSGPDYSRQEGSLGGSALAGSEPRTNPALPQGQRTPLEVAHDGSSPSGQGEPETAQGQGTSNIPSQTSGNSPQQTQTQILRGGEIPAEIPREDQGSSTGRVPGIHISNPQLGRGPTPGNPDESQASRTGTESQGENIQSRPFYGYYPTGYNPPETRVPESDSIQPVPGNSQAAPQSSFNRPTGNNQPSNPQGSSSNSRPNAYNPNIPRDREAPISNGYRGSPNKNTGTPSQSGVTSGRTTPGRTTPDRGTSYNSQTRLPVGSYPSQNRGPGQVDPSSGRFTPDRRPNFNSQTRLPTGVNPNQNRGPNAGIDQEGNPAAGPVQNRPRGPYYGGAEPDGDIVYNPNYRPPPNQGLPLFGGQGVPSGAQPGPGYPTNGQGTPSRTGYGRPPIGQGQGPNPRPYPFQPNPDALPDLGQPSSNLPQTSGQIGVYPNPGARQPSVPGFGQENPETNYSPFNGGVPRPVVPVGGENPEVYAGSEDYSSSVGEEGPGNEATLGGNPGLPDPAVNPEGLYIWMETGVTECSVSCAGGTRETIVQCISENSFFIADDSMCNSEFKPASRRKACNIDPCPPVWEEGEWSTCSRTCGEGRQIRPVTCKQRLTRSVVRPVSPDQCIGLEKPTTTRVCNADLPCTSWQQGSWGQCSAECGEGERRRDLTCVTEDGREVPDSECIHLLKPEETMSCSAGPCRTSWFTSEWATQCSADCGSGTLSRSVICSTEGTTEGAVADGQCSADRPDQSKTCTEAPCGPRWFTSDWSRCSVACGTGTQTRDVVCISSDLSPRILPTYQCPVPRPETTRPCEETECAGVHWFTSDWSECSQSCGGGHRTRHAKCLDGMMQPSIQCEMTNRPTLRQSCNIQQCHVVQHNVPASCIDKFSYCDKIHQARLCTYSYYRQKCCRSCYQQHRK